MKKIVVGIILMLGFALLQPAQAQTNSSIVIIDTAIDTTLPELQGKVIHEVCLLEELRCPNGKAFQEGLGSATLPVPQVYNGGFSHGTRMTQIAIKNNPNLNIVFIRIFPAGKNGNVEYAAANANSTVKQAIDWVIKNKTKFNIVAVSASVGHKVQPSAPNSCQLRSKFDVGLKQSLAQLKSTGVAFISSTGNRADKGTIDYPACLADAIAVSSVTEHNTVASYANDSLDVDFYALGTYELSSGKVSGTSAATAAFAAYWAKNYKGTYQLTYDYLKSIGTISLSSQLNLEMEKRPIWVDVLK